MLLMGFLHNVIVVIIQIIIAILMIVPTYMMENTAKACLERKFYKLFPCFCLPCTKQIPSGDTLSDGTVSVPIFDATGPGRSNCLFCFHHVDRYKWNCWRTAHWQDQHHVLHNK